MRSPKTTNRMPARGLWGQVICWLRAVGAGFAVALVDAIAEDTSLCGVTSIPVSDVRPVEPLTYGSGGRHLCAILLRKPPLRERLVQFVSALLCSPDVEAMVTLHNVRSGPRNAD